MAIERYEVKTYEVDMKCDICGRGYYRPTGTAVLSSPVIYPHKCNVCGAEMNVQGYAFPRTVTERIEDMSMDVNADIKKAIEDAKRRNVSLDEREIWKISSVFQNYYCIGLSEIAEEDEVCCGLFEKLGLI